MNIAYLALGSNMGSRELNLNQAIEQLKKQGTVVAVSSFIDTAPMYIEDQDRFLNAALEFHTKK